MKVGDLVMTNKIEVRTDPGPRPSIRANFKANPGHAFVFLNFGTVQSTDEVDDRVLKVMKALGWVACDDIDGLRAALAAAEVDKSPAQEPGAQQGQSSAREGAERSGNAN